MRKYSYESILSAVGQVLDEVEAQSFAIRDDGNGLRVETMSASGEPLVLNFNLADLVELIDMKVRAGDEPHYERSYGRDERTLEHFLERHELIGAGR